MILVNIFSSYSLFEKHQVYQLTLMIDHFK